MDKQLYQDIAELIETRLTPKQLDKYNNLRGYFANRLRKVTKAAWTTDAIAEVERRRDARQEAEYQAFDRFAARVKDRIFKANVLWFRQHDGEGWIYIPELELKHPIYACNIKGKHTWYPETACVYYEKGQEVEVSVTVRGLGQSVFIIGQTPGTFDSDKWQRLDTDRLAFKCDDSGKAINGLLA